MFNQKPKNVIRIIPSDVRAYALFASVLIDWVIVTGLELGLNTCLQRKRNSSQNYNNSKQRLDLVLDLFA